MKKEQLIKEFREKFVVEANVDDVFINVANEGELKELEAFLLSAFDAGEKNGIVIGRAGGIEEAVRRCAGVITCTQDIDGDVCDCCQRNFEVIDSLTPSSSKDN